MYCALDTEHTGFHEGSNLLTAAFVVFDWDGAVIDELDLSLKHPTYNVDLKAMEVNKIDLFEHDARAEELSACAHKLRCFLNKHTYNKESKERELLIPVGSGVQADINLLAKSGLPTFGFSHQVRDLTIIASFLRECGVIKAEKIGLENLAKYARIPHNAHTAIGDARASMEVFIWMTTLILWF